MSKQQRLVVVTEHGITVEMAMRMKEQIEEHIKIPVTVLSGVRQVVLIESDAGDAGDADD